MPYGNLYDFEERVRGYEKRVNDHVAHRRLVRAALDARAAYSARTPFVARIGAWMVRAGTALQGRTGRLIVVAAQPPVMEPDREPC